MTQIPTEANNKNLANGCGVGTNMNNIHEPGALICEHSLQKDGWVSVHYAFVVQRYWNNCKQHTYLPLLLITREMLAFAFLTFTKVARTRNYIFSMECFYNFVDKFDYWTSQPIIKIRYAV